MGRRDLLPNAIYQRIKQLQSRLKKRTEEEERRLKMAERAANARWEEHQRKVLQFENYLKSLNTPMPESRGKNPKPAKVEGMSAAPPNSRTGSTPLHEAPTLRSISLEHVELVETCISTQPPSSPSHMSNMSRAETVTPSYSSKSASLSTSPRMSNVRVHGKVNQHGKLEEISSQTRSEEGERADSRKNDRPMSIGKSNLAQALTELENKSDSKKASVSSSAPSLEGRNSNNGAGFSRTFSPPPSLPSTPSLSATPIHQTPLPGPELPAEGDLAVQSPVLPQQDVPNISVTKMATASLDSNSNNDITSQKKVKQKPKKKTPKPLKKKLNRPRPEKSPKQPTKVVEPVAEVEPVSRSKSEAKKEIKMIFDNVNAIPEDELTEEAFDVFLDTIKQLSEYVDEDEIDSQNYEVIDDFSSEFSYENYLRDNDGNSLTPDKMFAPSPASCLSRNSTCSTPGNKPRLEKGHQVAKLTRQQTRDRRQQRMLVVREKQNDIIRFRKVTLAELRLRRQRALMRAKTKILENVREREEIERQRIRLLELAHMNEKQRLERQAQLKREEEERIRIEEEEKRQKEKKVKEELELLMKQSKKRLEEEEKIARENREMEEAALLEGEDEVSSTEDESENSVYGRDIAQTWRSVAKRARNRDVFENMVKQNSANLYKTLVRELLIEKQKSNITDIPGFSYFLLVKYTMDPSDILDIMLEL